MPFILGIPLWYFFPSIFIYQFYLIAILIIIQFFTSYIPKFYPKYRWRYFSTTIIYFSFILLGSTAAKYQFPYQHVNYFGFEVEKAGFIMAKVVESPIETTKSQKLIVEIQYLIVDTNKTKVVGKALIYIPKDSIAPPLAYGSLLILKNKFEPIKQPTNPNSFDYKLFMERKGVKYSAFLKTGDYQLLGKDDAFSIKKIALDIRDFLLLQLKKNGLEGEEFGMAASLILGYRDALSDDLVSAYRTTGVMHVLSVSGMHVGILYLILSQLLGFLKHIKKGLTIRLIIILINIWLFALITGLSPSVIRAAVMFTFVAIGKNINREINIYNTLAASAMMTLVFDPFSLFDIGFQLSYIAVFSIAALYKPIYSLWIPKYKLPDFLWQSIAVSLAAQIGTSPISLFYFHQFPNYFILSNLVVMILVTPIFYLALASLALSFIPFLASLLALGTSYTIKLMNFLIVWLQSLPFSLIENITFSPFVLLLLSLLISFVAAMLINKAKQLIYINLSITILLISISIFHKNEEQKLNQIVIFDTAGKLAILYQKGESSVMLTDSLTHKNHNLIGFQTDGFLSTFNLQPNFINMDSKGDFFGLIYRNNNFVGMGDKLVVFYNPKQRWAEKVECDFLVIRDRKQYDMNKILENYIPKTIVLSTELWASQRDQLKTSLLDTAVTMYDIAEKGALVIPIL